MDFEKLSTQDQEARSPWYRVQYPSALLVARSGLKHVDPRFGGCELLTDDEKKGVPMSDQHCDSDSEDYSLGRNANVLQADGF